MWHARSVVCLKRIVLAPPPSASRIQNKLCSNSLRKESERLASNSTLCPLSALCHQSTGWPPGSESADSDCSRFKSISSSGVLLIHRLIGGQGRIRVPGVATLTVCLCEEADSRCIGVFRSIFRSIDELSGRTTGRLGYIRPDTAHARDGRAGVVTYATSGALASSRDALRADSDLRA